MVLKAFGGSLGLLLGALGGFLGSSWELFGASRSTKEGLQIRLETLLGLVCSLLAAEDGFGRVLGPSLARFGCSRGPFKGCFGIRQTDFDHQNCPSELRYVILSCCCCCCCYSSFSSSSCSCFCSCPSSCSCCCSCCCSCRCCPRFPLTLQLLLDSARRNARSD